MAAAAATATASLATVKTTQAKRDKVQFLSDDVLLPVCSFPLAGAI